jgi:aldehyde dehydrogenase (NAD+)
MATMIQPEAPIAPPTLFIGGEWRDGTHRYERRDPASLDRVTGVFTAATTEDVDAAYDAAARAQTTWSALPAPARATVLSAAADILERRADEAAHRLTDDMGKAVRDARGEVQRAIAIFRYFGGEATQPSGETYPSADPATFLMTVEAPLGIVALITPWNFPFAIPTWKLAPALVFGNAAIWKPAEAASGSAVFLTKVLEEAGLPAGVLNLVTGRGRELSSALLGDGRLAAVSFTGSNAVGTSIRQAVADRNVKVQLELGGKNPAIVLADADLDNAAAQVARGAMLQTGQRCTATSRVYVDRRVLDEFRELLLERVRGFVIGDPHDDSTDIGPLASGDQLETVRGYLDVAREEGVTFAAGGGEEQTDACYITPAVLEGVRPDSRLLTEEIFGPVVVLEPIDGFAEGLAAANATKFGLSTSVFTRDLGTAMTFVRRAEAGIVHINRETAGVEPHVPFGGIKESSSMHREQGKAARSFFTTSKTVYMRFDAP